MDMEIVAACEGFAEAASAPTLRPLVVACTLA
jgi:hypothetical protein